MQRIRKKQGKQRAGGHFCALLSAFCLSGLFAGGVKTKRRTVITIETDRVFVIRSRGGSVHAWCAKCDEQVRMVTPDEAAVFSRVSSRTIYRWVEAEKLHFVETPKGLLFLCLNSLPR